MKRLALALAAAAGLNGCIMEYRDYHPAVNPVDPADVPQLCAAGYNDGEVRALIDANGVSRKPTADDLINLKKAGVSEPVMNALVEAPVRQPSPAYERRHREVYYVDPDPLLILGVGVAAGYIWGRHIRCHH